jgi:hypothetical protein
MAMTLSPINPFFLYATSQAVVLLFGAKTLFVEAI